MMPAMSMLSEKDKKSHHILMKRKARHRRHLKHLVDREYREFELA